MELAPICVFCYNRPSHLAKTLEALSKNEFSKESVLYIFCDGAKPLTSSSNREDSGQNTVRKFFTGSEKEYDCYLNDIHATQEIAKSQTWAKELHVEIQKSNIGLADSIVNGVTKVVKKHGRIIVIEDDIITSPGFLRFMNEALEVYLDEEKVMHISGYMYPHKQRLPDTFFFKVPYPGGGWATWERAWRYYNNSTHELYELWKNRWQDFDILGSNYLSQQLIANEEGRMKTWFIKWHAVLLQKGALTLYPGKSLTNNIGFDNTATNCTPQKKFDVIPVDNVKVQKRPIKVHRRGYRVIYTFYQGHWYNKRRRRRFIGQLKSTLFRILPKRTVNYKQR